MLSNFTQLLQGDAVLVDDLRQFELLAQDSPAAQTLFNKVKDFSMLVSTVHYCIVLSTYYCNTTVILLYNTDCTALYGTVQYSCHLQLLGLELG